MNAERFKEYVEKILRDQIQKRLTADKGYSDIKDLPDNWESYKVQKEVGKDGAPTESVIRIISTAKGRHLVISNDSLKKDEAKLLEKGLEPISQSPDTVSAEELKKLINKPEIEHECK